MSSLMKENYKIKANYNRNIKIISGLIIAFCILLTIISILPIWILICNACRANTEITNQGAAFIPGTFFFTNFENLMDPKVKAQFDAAVGFKNSLIITIASTFFAVFFASLTAYGLTVYKFKFNDAAFTFILAVLMVPTQVSGLGYFKMVATIEGTNNLLAIILPAMAAPAVVFYMRQYMKSSFPLEIVEAARIDGSSEFRTFIKIGLPMCAPALAVQCIFSFIANWNNYYMPSILLTSSAKKTIPVMLKALGTNTIKDQGQIYCAILLSILPLIIAYLIFSRYIVAGVALGGVKE